jgi:hypothetical protein
MEIFAVCRLRALELEASFEAIFQGLNELKMLTDYRVVKAGEILVLVRSMLSIIWE